MRTTLFFCSLMALVGAGCSDDMTPTLDGPAGQDAVVDLVADGPLTDAPRSDLPRPDRGPDGPSADLFWADGSFPQCAAVAGKCTPQRWIICPVNTEPADPDPHQDCGSGWCCTAAPTSTCSASASTNCVVGTACVGCWGPATNAALSCEAGRVCCEDICD